MQEKNNAAPPEERLSTQEFVVDLQLRDELVQEGESRVDQVSYNRGGKGGRAGKGSLARDELV